MSFFLAESPGAFAFVGSAPPDKKGSPHHSPTFNIDEESLVIGAELVTRTGWVLRAEQLTIHFTRCRTFSPLNLRLPQVRATSRCSGTRGAIRRSRRARRG